MTGGEIAAIGLVRSAAKAAGALEGDAEERAQLARIAEGSEALEVAAQAKADRVAIRQLALTKLWTPLARWVNYRSAYFDNGDFAADLANRLDDVPLEDLVSPSPVVAAQSMEGLSYSLDEPDLKEMYLSLLATASDSRRRDSAHPSFAQLVKQLSSAEASHLLEILSLEKCMAIEIRNVEDSTRGYHVLQRHVCPLFHSGTGEPMEVPDWALFVDNWVRLGLVTVDYSSYQTGDDSYSWADSRPEMIRHRELYANVPGRSVQYRKGLIQRTNLGASFARAVAPRTASGRSATGGVGPLPN